VLNREQANSQIAKNIGSHGYHFYIIAGGAVPRYAYTIGLSASPVSSELIFAGAYRYLAAEVEEILRVVVAHLLGSGERSSGGMDIGVLRTFSLRAVHKCWVDALAFGAMDYYSNPEIAFLQIVPDDDGRSIDVPDMRRPLKEGESSPWQWLWQDWSYPIPEGSTAATEIAVLEGKTVTEAGRWEPDGWELFAGDASLVDKSNVRVVPIGTLVAADATLLPILELEVGKAMWRSDVDGEWHEWN
jgi:hypothetical protein